MRPVYYTDSGLNNVFSPSEGVPQSGTIHADWDATGYRLPTEAEWEYAARGARSSQGYHYSGSDNLDDVAWSWSNSGSTTHMVGGKQANELGLDDMSGNVSEWCWDWHGSYSSDSQIDPRGPSSGSARVKRVGGWRSGWGNDDTSYFRVAFRRGDSPDYFGFNYNDYFGSFGFRVVRNN